MIIFNLTEQIQIKKAIKYIVLAVILVIFGLLSYLTFALPDVGDAEDITIELTPERIERGRYLANSVNVCMDCHSTRDWNHFSGPMVEGTQGQGGELFDQKFGFPGSFISKNITPAGVGDWTDGELLRAIASGVGKDGKALFPVMPHESFGKMSREDLYSIIAYLRTLKPIENEVAESEADFPMNIIINTIPKKANYSTMPNPSDKLAYGAYVFNAASCGMCHTPHEKGSPVAGMELAGGFIFPLPSGGVARSANITPDKETGIGNWTEEFFVNRFLAYADSGYIPAEVKPRERNTVMPWTMYSKMTETDLKAIYAYLQTQPAISNVVVKFSASEYE